MSRIPNATITRHGMAARADFTFSEVFLVLPADLNLAMKLQCSLRSDQTADPDVNFSCIVNEWRARGSRKSCGFNQALPQIDE